MLIHITPSLAMKVKNLWRKRVGTSWYYKRRYPKEIAALLNYPPSGHKVVCLFTTDEVKAAGMALKLAAQDDAEWARLCTGKAPSLREEAGKLLARFGISSSHPKDASEHDFNAFVEHMEGLLGPEGMERAGEGEDVTELLPPVAATAVRMARGQFCLSDALDFYLLMNGKGKGADFEKVARIAVQKLMDVCGDRELTTYRRGDVNKFIGSLLDGGNSTSTVRRRLNSLQAIFAVAIHERELGCANPFERAVIPGEGGDKKKRLPFDQQQEAILRYAVGQAKPRDDLAHILAMLLDTGARLAEIVGLRVDDVVLSGPISYLTLRHHPHRRLKNDSSIRDVPLVGAALVAAKLAVEQADRTKNAFLFSRYTDESGCNSLGASATLNRRIAGLGIPLTCHSLRHTMRDRLRAVECPLEIIDRIGGWTTPGVGSRYGLGHSIEMLERWLGKAIENSLVKKSESLLT